MFSKKEGVYDFRLRPNLWFKVKYIFDNIKNVNPAIWFTEEQADNLEEKRITLDEARRLREYPTLSKDQVNKLFKESFEAPWGTQDVIFIDGSRQGRAIEWVRRAMKGNTDEYLYYDEIEIFI